MDVALEILDEIRCIRCDLLELRDKLDGLIDDLYEDEDETEKS